MEQKYEIPPEGGGHLGIGQWVEIFEAYGDAEGKRAIQVKSMRVGGKTLTFAGETGGSSGTRALRPHEGRVVSIEQGHTGTRFNIRLRS